MTNDASAQERVHRYQFFLGGLAIVALAILGLPRVRPSAERRFESAGPFWWFERGAAVLLAGALVWAWKAPNTVPHTRMRLFAGFYGSVTTPSFRFYVVAAIIAAVALPVVIWLTPRVSARIWWWLLLAYCLAVTLPGLGEPIVLAHTSPAILRVVEWHFDSVLGGSYTLVAGSPERHIGYTYLLSLAKALVERHAGYLSFAADVRLVQWLNIAFALSMLWACYVWDRARPLIAALTVALVLPWIHNNHQNIFFPNQSGVRFLFFPLTIVLLRYSHHLTTPRAAEVSGAFAALALTWNLETGLAVATGLVVHLAARSDSLSPKSVVPATIRFLVGMAAGLSGVVLLSGLGLGLWPLQFGVPGRLVQRTATGFGYGYPLYLDPAAIIVFGYAIWAVLDLAVARRAGTVDPRTADRGAVGAVALVWAAYYILQPHPWNIWSYLLPGGILLGETLFPRRARPPWSSSATQVLRIPFVLAVMIAVPAATLGTLLTWQSLERGTALAGVATLDSARIGRMLSGVMVTAADADAIESRAAYLKTVPADTFVMTGNSYLLPKLSGRAELFRRQDPAYSATTRTQFEQLISTIRTRSPSLLLFDDPATLAVDDVHRQYYAQLEAELPDRYRLERVSSGWSIWRSNSAATRARERAAGGEASEAPGQPAPH